MTAIIANHTQRWSLQRRQAAIQAMRVQEAKCNNVSLTGHFCLILFQLVSEQQESRPLLSPSIDDFLCETKCDGAARPVTSNTAGTRYSPSRVHNKLIKYKLYIWMLLYNSKYHFLLIFHLVNSSLYCTSSAYNSRANKHITEEALQEIRMQ